MANKAKAQTEQKPKGVTYTFGGEYYCRQDKGLGSKTYELTVTFPEFLQAPLSVFKKGVSENKHPIRNLMLKKYPDFTSVRTYSVIKIVNNTNTKPKKTDDINTMDIVQLQAYINDNELDFAVVVYDNDVVKVREAIKLAQENPEDFKNAYAEAVREYEYKKALEDLNPDGGERDGDKDGADESGVDDLLDDLDGDKDGADE